MNCLLLIFHTFFKKNEIIITKEPPKSIQPPLRNTPGNRTSSYCYVWQSGLADITVDSSNPNVIKQFKSKQVWINNGQLSGDRSATIGWYSSNCTDLEITTGIRSWWMCYVIINGGVFVGRFLLLSSCVFISVWFGKQGYTREFPEIFIYK